MLIKSSIFVFLVDGNLIGLVLGSSKSVDPSSGSLLLLINASLLGLIEDRSLSLNSFLSLLGGSFLGLLSSLSGNRGIRVQPVHSSLVGEWVLLSVLDLRNRSGGSNGTLDFI